MHHVKVELLITVNIENEQVKESDNNKGVMYKKMMMWCKKI